ncbi:hypothetical protein ACFFK7_11820 [Pseudoalteromonas xiamenensis]|uniref:hypothetical protein n=1 Tax=Pseudoalteromonas xiamenensis TaxID=882626 RepID=UPI0035EFB5B5
MNAKSVATIVLCSLPFVSLASESTCSTESLEGSWTLNYAKYTNSAGVVVGEIKDKSTLSRKSLVDGTVHFITWTPNGEVKVAASGHYSSANGRYIETVDISTYEGILGKTFDFGCRLENGVWIHEGLENDLTILEKWTKTK